MKAKHYPSNIQFYFDDDSKNFEMSSDNFFNSADDERFNREDVKEWLEEMKNLTNEEIEFVLDNLETYEWI